MHPTGCQRHHSARADGHRGERHRAGRPRAALLRHRAGGGLPHTARQRRAQPGHQPPAHALPQPRSIVSHTRRGQLDDRRRHPLGRHRHRRQEPPQPLGERGGGMRAQWRVHPQALCTAGRRGMARSRQPRLPRDTCDARRLLQRMGYGDVYHPPAQRCGHW